MTEIMPVPRNSHITVLRPPSIAGGFFVKFRRTGRNTFYPAQERGKIGGVVRTKRGYVCEASAQLAAGALSA